MSLPRRGQPNIWHPPPPPPLCIAEPCDADVQRACASGAAAGQLQPRSMFTIGAVGRCLSRQVSIACAACAACWVNSRAGRLLVGLRRAGRPRPWPSHVRLTAGRALASQQGVPWPSHLRLAAGRAPHLSKPGPNASGAACVEGSVSCLTITLDRAAPSPVFCPAGCRGETAGGGLPGAGAGGGAQGEEKPFL